MNYKMSHVPVNKLYFSILPTDLLISLFMFFDSTQLLQILPQLENIREFNRLFNSQIFWLKIWRRDISSFASLPTYPYQNYKFIFSTLTSYHDVRDKSQYLMANGYDILLLPLLNTPEDYNYVMAQAAYGGYVKIVQLMLTKGANNYNWALAEAAEGGHLDIVNLMLEKGAYKTNSALLRAAGEGHIDIVKRMLDYGATDYETAWRSAMHGGNTDIAKLIKSYM